MSQLLGPLYQFWSHLLTCNLPILGSQRSNDKNYIISDQAELSRLFQIAREAGGFDDKRVRAAYDNYQQATMKFLADMESLGLWDWRREEAICDKYKAHLYSKIDSMRSIFDVNGRLFNIKY